MLYRCVGLAVGTTILWAAGAATANEIHFQNLGLGLAPPPIARQDGLHHGEILPRDSAEYHWTSGGEWTTPRVPRPLKNRRLPLVSGYQSEQDRGTPRAAVWEAPVRPPSTESRVLPGQTHFEPQPNLPQPVDGTWRDDGQYLILNVNGQELRLLKESQVHAPDSPTEEDQLTGGIVQGRLSHQGRPLVNCRVALIPLTKGFTGYKPNRSGQPVSATSDGSGAYRFQGVAAGSYKLSWLPEGTNQWIRRIAMRPDAVVRDGETVSIKEIRVALKTLN